MYKRLTLPWHLLAASPQYAQSCMVVAPRWSEVNPAPPYLGLSRNRRFQRVCLRHVEHRHEHEPDAFLLIGSRWRVLVVAAPLASRYVDVASGAFPLPHGAAGFAPLLEPSYDRECHARLRRQEAGIEHRQGMSFACDQGKAPRHLLTLLRRHSPHLLDQPVHPLAPRLTFLIAAFHVLPLPTSLVSSAWALPTDAPAPHTCAHARPTARQRDPARQDATLRPKLPRRPYRAKLARRRRCASLLPLALLFCSCLPVPPERARAHPGSTHVST